MQELKEKKIREEELAIREQDLEKREKAMREEEEAKREKAMHEWFVRKVLATFFYFGGLFF
jgi:hypothetical protein